MPIHKINGVTGETTVIEFGGNSQAQQLSNMPSIKQWLRDANVVFGDSDFDNKIPSYVHMALLNPECWQAVGKTRGWVDRPAEAQGKRYEWHEWRDYMHRFIDHRADGLTIDEALKAIS